eukprot:CAMPEP_0173406218 /NCGR_PEP_ID=MMETSP1356-20130122/64031_1 /TAXON_ID=77927 ORGANISM="Hemiselmis virescens, Strain PCC157" /NCGR_SAMPLE_ID=MMETSP1356 /ASSEMBLY_ACC=CAM_ASM_000847 /LENGTH=68 /DNA_ID=CAMNT_0014367163 /DNA_START=415 /DNA_END=621 /DNA_ORIENTATION=-
MPFFSSLRERFPACPGAVYPSAASMPASSAAFRVTSGIGESSPTNQTTIIRKRAIKSAEMELKGCREK